MFNGAALDLIFDNEDADVATTVITCSNDIILKIMEVEGFHYDTASDNESVEDHRRRPRGPRKMYDHERALQCIQADYLSPNALYASEFVSMFCISRTCFEHLMSAVMSTELPIYKHAKNHHGGVAASFES